MDPITSIGMLASIANLVGTSKEVIRLIKSFKEGEKELAELASHVALFEENLKGFDRIFRSRQMIHRVSAETLTQAIEKSSATLKDLEKRLSQIFKSDKSAVRRMKWVQNKSSLERIGDRIKGQCAMLHSLVSVAQMEMILVVCSQNPHLLDICSSVAEEMESSSSYSKSSSAVSTTPRPIPPLLMTPHDTTISRGNFPPGYQPEDSGPFPRTSESSNRRTSDSSLLMPGVWTTSPRGSISTPRRGSDATSTTTDGGTLSSRSSTSSARSSIFSSGTSVANSSILVPDNEDGRKSKFEATQGRELERPPTNSLVIRRACRFDCYCKCHGQSVWVSNEVFSRFNGPVFRGNKGAEVECTEPDCAGAASSQRRVLPSAFFKRAISHLMSSQSVKVRYNLNTYRMVPEGSDAMRYVKHGNLEKLKMSIQMGEATPWDTAPDGWSLLHTAVYARQLPTVKYLYELGADTEAADLGARKPADLAILKSLTADATKVEEEIVRIFSKEDDYLSDFEFTPIHIAVLDLYDPTDNERPSLEQLIEFVDNANNAAPGTDWGRWKTTFRKKSPLFLAIIEQFRVSAIENHNTYKVIHNLLDQKDRKFHWTPLHWASTTNRAEKMKILIENGADPFIQSNLNANIIHAAVESNALQSPAYALEICKCYPDRLNIDQANVWGESPLIMAAQGCLVDCVQLLLEAGADRNIRQENQQVALHYAGLSKRGKARQETVTLLCKGKNRSCAHINAQDEDGRSPVFDFLDDSECMEILVRHGARLDLLDKSGKSVFHHVCIQDENEQLKTLLRLSPDSAMILREKDIDGNTALIEALRHGSVDSAMTLLEFDDVGDVVGQGGWAVVHYAAKLGDPDLLEMVLKHPSFEKGLTTGDGKTVQIVAMESGNWCGRVKELVRKYNSIT